MKKKTRLSASGYEYMKKLEEIERKFMNDAINGIPIVNNTQHTRSGEFDASRIVLRDIRQQEGISQEKRAEMANRIQRARNKSSNESSSFRGKFVNFDNINMYGTHVNGESRKSRESVKEGLRKQSTVKAVSDALDGRYPLERNTRAVTFCYDDFMKVVELISKVTDIQLREDIVMSIIEAKSNACDLLGK